METGLHPLKVSDDMGLSYDRAGVQPAFSCYAGLLAFLELCIAW